MSVVKIILGLVFFLLVVGLLVFYWFPGDLNFGSARSSNFSVSNEFVDMQFYPNMRFSTTSISYNIDGACILQKQDDMEMAFEIISEKTGLSFYSVESDEQISVTCDEENKMNGGLFIAGEGGPTNITKAGEFSVIEKGKILLIRSSNCENPNVAIHELLHVLGFKHSDNSKNIMYPTTKCSQEIGEDTIALIKNLYSYPSYPDLVFENVSAKIENRLLDAEITVRNAGLANAGASEVILSVNEKEIKRFEIEELEIGYGRMVAIENLGLLQFDIDELEFEIVYDGNELEKENNKIKLTKGEL